MSDEGLLRFHDNIRQQAELDRPNKGKFMGPNVRQYAEGLRQELVKRRLSHPPIDWPP